MGPKRKRESVLLDLTRSPLRTGFFVVEYFGLSRTHLRYHHVPRRAERHLERRDHRLLRCQPRMLGLTVLRTGEGVLHTCIGQNTQTTRCSRVGKAISLTGINTVQLSSKPDFLHGFEC